MQGDLIEKETALGRGWMWPALRTWKCVVVSLAEASGDATRLK